MFLFLGKHNENTQGTRNDINYYKLRFRPISYYHAKYIKIIEIIKHISMNSHNSNKPKRK